MKESCDHPIKVQFLHCLLIGWQNEPLEELLRNPEIFQDGGIGPQGNPRVDEVPFSGAAIGVVGLLDVALDLVGALAVSPFFLSSGGGIGPFFLASAACLPFLEGKMLGVLSRGRFSPMSIPFTPRLSLSPFGQAFSCRSSST